MLFAGLGSARMVKNWDLGLKALGHSFSPYGPPSRQMTYNIIYSLCQPDILSISLAYFFAPRYSSNNTKCEDKSNRGILLTHPSLVYMYHQPPGGGGTLETLGRGVRLTSQNPYPTDDQNLLLLLPYL